MAQRQAPPLCITKLIPLLAVHPAAGYRPRGTPAAASPTTMGAMGRVIPSPVLVVGALAALALLHASGAAAHEWKADYPYTFTGNNTQNMTLELTNRWGAMRLIGVPRGRVGLATTVTGPTASSKFATGTLHPSSNAPAAFRGASTGGGGGTHARVWKAARAHTWCMGTMGGMGADSLPCSSHPCRRAHAGTPLSASTFARPSEASAPPPPAVLRREDGGEARTAGLSPVVLASERQSESEM